MLSFMPRTTRKAPAGVIVHVRPGDKDAVIELQPLLDRAYANGAYDDVNYANDCVPPLEGADAQWAQQVLKVAGKR
jgi:hypothetical protein